MRNYVKNKMMNRLTYCKDWKNTVEIYLEGKKIKHIHLVNTFMKLLEFERSPN